MKKDVPMSEEEQRRALIQRIVDLLSNATVDEVRMALITTNGIIKK
jgi:hypothetical protein